MNTVLQFKKKLLKIYKQHYFCKRKKYTDTIKNDKIVKLPWVPKLGPKLRKAFHKFAIKTIFTSRRNSKNLVCRNKSKLPPNGFPFYDLDCNCDALYIGKTKRKSSLGLL